MKKFVLYQHGGSLNHGCEALATTISKELVNEFCASSVSLCSLRPEEDNISSVSSVVKSKGIKKWNFPYLFYQFNKRITKSKWVENLFCADKSCIAEKADCFIAIGGDNYCYHKGQDMWATDRMLKKKGNKLMLWAASIEPDDLPGALSQHLEVFDLITARESITYNALVANGLGDKTHLVSDPAFLLETENLSLPPNWKEGQMVGINLSPLLLHYTDDRETVIDSVRALIEHILKETDMNIALISHVRNDINVLQPLYEEYCATNRLVLIDSISLNCKQLKGYISRCRFFIGARTHSIIAAYSTAVPAIALGYSVKANGIARDLFGSEEHFVVPVQTLSTPELTLDAFKYLVENEDSIKNTYNEKLPAYIENAKKSVQLLSDMINGD